MEEVDIERVAAIWYRRLTAGDFFNIERRPDAGPAGGGGQTYVDIPTEVRHALFTFLGVPEPADGEWPAISRDVAVLGRPDWIRPLRFELNRQGETRYRIARQLRQAPDSERHPAWTADFEFPAAPDRVRTRAEAADYLPPGGTRLFLVRTVDDRLFAGHASGSDLPAGWPAGVGLDRLFMQQVAGGVIICAADAPRQLFLEPTDRGNPFRVDDAWSDDELAIVVELYIDHGGEPERKWVEATQDRIRERTGRQRTDTDISAKLTEMASMDPLAGGDADREQPARDVWGAWAADADALREALARPEGVPNVSLEATANTVLVRVTTVETASVDQFRTRGTADTIAERREQRLVARYQIHLQGQGHTVTAHIYVLPGYPSPLRCDLFDESNATLVEAKGLVSREMMRMAIGQLLDYRRFEREGPNLQVLLPWRPAPDLLALAHSVGASVAWATAEGFEVAELPGG